MNDNIKTINFDESPELKMDSSASEKKTGNTDNKSYPELGNAKPDDAAEADKADKTADGGDGGILTLEAIRKMTDGDIPDTDIPEAPEMLARLRQSLICIEGFREGSGKSLQEIESAVNRLLTISADTARGLISADAITLMTKALDYDAAVERARAEGEIAGRNANIEERLDKTPKGDGVPALSGSASTRTKTRPSTIFDLAGFAR